MVPGSNKSDKPVVSNGINEIRLNCDCINGSIVDSIREPILYPFALSSPPGHKIYKERKINFFKKINKSILSHIKLYLEDDVYELVDFNGITISFTSQLIKKQ